MDLSQFDFDLDLTWAGFFVNADDRIYGRYGGRDASGPEKRLALAGLKHALEAALAAHKAGNRVKPPAPARKPVLAEQYAAARGMKGCVHCHNIYQFQQEELARAGRWRKELAWVYPLPENAGLSLEVDVGNRVQSVKADSPAGKAGLRPGDLLETVNGVPVVSQADARYGLHRAPEAGQIAVAWQRDGKKMSGTLALADGWRRSDMSWRRSMTDLLSSFIVRGPDLNAAEKKAINLAENRLAFRVEGPILKQPMAAGVQEGDIVLGINSQPLEMSAEQFPDYLRGHYQAGERITLNILRNGKPQNLPVTLK